MAVRIGLDIDGVLADFTPSYLNSLIAYSGGHFPKDWSPKTDPTSWHWEESYGFKREDVERFWEWARSPQGKMFWYDLPSLLTGKEATKVKDTAQKQDVYYISKRPLAHKATTEEWITRHYTFDVGSRPPTVILSNKKGYVAEGLHLHGMIDDKPQNLLDIALTCGSKVDLLLLDQPWNRQFDDTRYERIFSVSEGIDKIIKGVL